jgi:hypothetical protein
VQGEVHADRFRQQRRVSVIAGHHLHQTCGGLNRPAGGNKVALANKWIILPAADTGDLSGLTLQGIAAGINATDSPLNPTTAIKAPAGAISPDQAAKSATTGT